MHDLILLGESIESQDVPALFCQGGLETILARIESDARSLVADVGTVKGRSEIASTAAKVAKAKTYLDGLGKDLTADLKRQTGAVDAARKAMRDRMDALKVEVRRPLTEWEQAEDDRMDLIKEKMDQLRVVLPGYLSAYGVSEVIREIEGIEINESFAEFRDEAHQIKDATLYRLGCQQMDAAEREAEDARKAAAEAEERARAQAEREARIAREAAERATMEAERSVREAQARVTRAEAMGKYRAQIAVENEKARVAKEQAEADRVKAREAEMEAKRKANMEYRKRIYAEIVDDIRAVGDAYDLRLMGIEIPEQIVKAIAAGKIRHLHIIY